MFYVYIAYFDNNDFHSISVTKDLVRRFKLLNQLEKRKGKPPCKLVYYEEFEDSSFATRREDELTALPKNMLRELVNSNNPMTCNLVE